MKEQITAKYNQDRRRYHRTDDGQGITGMIHILRDKPVHDNLSIILKTKGEKQE
jgi:hypothetical protein